MTINRQAFRLVEAAVIASVSARRPGRDQGTLNKIIIVGRGTSEKSSKSGKTDRRPRAKISPLFDLVQSQVTRARVKRGLPKRLSPPC